GDLFWLVHERLDQIFDETLQRLAPLGTVICTDFGPQSARRVSGYPAGLLPALASRAAALAASWRSRMPCFFSRERVTSVGCVPLPSQRSALSSSILMRGGSTHGSYCPMVSMKRPSREAVLFATTTR